MRETILFAFALCVAPACDTQGYSTTVDCQETFACCDELGDPVDESFTLDECRQATGVVIEQLSSQERADLDAIFDFCRDEGVSGCAFFECLTGESPTECPAIELQGKKTP